MGLRLGKGLYFFYADVRMAVYKAICLSILLYGCESWIPYRRHIKALEAYHVCCLQSILGIHWWHRKTYRIRDTAKIESIELLILQRQLRWLGHVTSYVCHPTIFYSMANCNSDEDQLADQSCFTQTTSSPYSGNATSQNLT